MATTRKVLILGTFDREDSIRRTLLEVLLAGARTAGTVLNTRWIPPREIALYPGLVTEADGVVLAPGALPIPPEVDEDILQAIELTRRFERPFLATGESGVLPLIEIARNVLGMRDAGLPLLTRKVHDPVAIALGDDPDHPPQKIGAPRTLTVREGADRVEEWSDSRFGLNPDYAAALLEAGLEVLTQEVESGRPLAFALADHPAWLASTFLPELGRGAAHPMIQTFLGAALRRG